MPELNDFDTDAHRRVLGNLGQPRSFNDLLLTLRVFDPHVGALGRTEQGLASVLADLEADGLVVNLGQFGSGSELVKAVAANKNVPTLHESKAEHFISRLDNPMRHPVLEGDQLYMTQKGRDKLMGPIPNEPGQHFADRILREAEEGE